MEINSLLEHTFYYVVNEKQTVFKSAEKNSDLIAIREYIANGGDYGKSVDVIEAEFNHFFKSSVDIIENYISDNLTQFNNKYNVLFEKVHNMGIYVFDDSYYLKDEVTAFIKWSIQVWAYARKYQEKVLTGEIDFDLEYFKSNLPVCECLEESNEGV